jgi:hypothetical protein
VRWTTEHDDESGLPVREGVSGEPSQQVEAVFSPPWWLLATLLGLLAVGGAVAAWGAIGSDDGDDVVVEVPPSTTLVPSTTTTAPSPTTKRDRPRFVPSTSAVPDVVVVGDELGQGAVEPISGREGGLWAWSGDSLYRADLDGGPWVKMAVGLADGDQQRNRLSRVGQGWLAASQSDFSGEFSYRLFDDALELIEERELNGWGQIVAANGMTVAILTQGFGGPSERVLLLRVNSDLTVSEFELDRHPLALAMSPDGRIWMSPAAGGVYELSAGGTRNRASGVPVAASNERILIFECGVSLDDCSYLSVGDRGSRGVEMPDEVAEALAVPGLWISAPDLSATIFLDYQRGSATLVDLAGGEPVDLGGMDLAFDPSGSFSWSADSAMLVSIGSLRGSGFVLDIATGVRHAIEAPDARRPLAYALGP